MAAREERGYEDMRSVHDRRTVDRVSQVGMFEEYVSDTAGELQHLEGYL